MYFLEEKETTSRTSELEIMALYACCFNTF